MNDKKTYKSTAEAHAARIEAKRRKEQRVVEEMIRLYCRKNHSGYDRKTGKMCPECQALSDYAKSRSEKCPFMDGKTFCSNCKVHCYRPDMREKIRVVMRFSGPRMLLYHPLLAVWHMITTVGAAVRPDRQKQKNGREHCKNKNRGTRCRAERGRGIGKEKK